MLVEQELFSILAAFALLRPTNLLNWPKHIPIKKTHDFLLSSVLLSPHFLSYPPAFQYQRAFWKWAIERMECSLQEQDMELVDNFEIDQRFYQQYLELLPASGPSRRLSTICGRGLPFTQQPPSDSYVTHYWHYNPQGSPTGRNVSDYQHVDLADQKFATLLESRRLIESGTTGLRTWRASFVLAQYLADNTDLIMSRRVLELGAGVGFLGIVVASLQLQCTTSSGSWDPGSVYLTDINEEVLSRCHHNVFLPCNSSSSHPNMQVQTLDWLSSFEDNQKNTLTSRLRNELRPDIIIGADIVFDPVLIPALVGVLKIALTPSKATKKENSGCECAFIALTHRNRTTVESFMSEAQAGGLYISTISLSTDQANDFALECVPEEQDVYLFRIIAK